MENRDTSIDRIRVAMTALVVFHHTAITYGGSGGWFYREIETSANPSGILLTLLCSTDQAYFMGFFFLLAGYFTTRSLERKGYAEFLCNRFLRLGIPLLCFGFLLGPVTIWLANMRDGSTLPGIFHHLWQNRQFVNGPLWFAEALLIFSLGYCLWRRLFGAPLGDAKRDERPLPKFRWWWLAAFGVGAGAVLLRQFFPTGHNYIGLQLGFFSSYIFLFAIGLAAYRYDWLKQLTWKEARPWLIVSACVWPTLLISAVASGATHGTKVRYDGGFGWPAILYALWEPLLAWGLIAGWLVFFRQYISGPSKLWDWLSRRAYAVYIIHPVVLVGISIALRDQEWPALVKFAVVGTASCIVCWLVADPLVRLPGIRKVV